MENLDLVFLESLANVLRMLVNSESRCINPANIDIADSNTVKAIMNFLKQNEAITITTEGWIVKPNGKAQLLLQEATSVILQKRQKEKDHLVTRIKDIGSLVLSFVAIVISIISMIISCSRG